MASLLYFTNKIFIMKKLPVFYNLIILSIFLSSCSAIEGIFKAGFWAGFIAVVVIIGLVIFLLASVFKKK